MPRLLPIVRQAWNHTGYPAVASGLLSAAALLWRGRSELRSAAAPINAPSHWVWGDRALREDRTSLRFTLTGMVTHLASAMFWGVLYDHLRRRHARPTVTHAVSDAAVVTATAACVDLIVVPQRLTPGFERRLSTRGLAWVYASFAAGLVLGAAMAPVRR
jgi:hypothetical protein